jgi:hypothetical protein
MKQLNMTVTAMVLACFSLNAWSIGWSADVDVDPMTDERTAVASSEFHGSMRSLPFPYSDLKARLSVQCAEDVNVIASFSSTINLNGDTNKPILRFDDRPAKSYSFKESASGKAMFFSSSNSEKMLAEMRTANSVKLAADWYGLGQVVFQISLDGSNAAVDEACGDLMTAMAEKKAADLEYDRQREATFQALYDSAPDYVQAIESCKTLDFAHQVSACRKWMFKYRDE